MLRASTDAGAPYIFAFVSPGGGVAVESRMTQDGGTGQVYASSAPLGTGKTIYLKLTRSGSIFTAYASGDGSGWYALGSIVLSNIQNDMIGGLAVTSSSSSAVTNATLDSVGLNQCLSGSICQDIGAPSPPGWQTYDGGTWTLGGGGNGTYGTSDQAHFVGQSLPGDGSFQARFVAQYGGSYNSKAGVMLRASADPGAPYIFAFVSPTGGVQVEDRTTQGGGAGPVYASYTPLHDGQSVYLRVARAGYTFTAYTSGDGSSWTPLGSTVITSMPRSILGGLVATSSSNGTLLHAVFDHVSISQCFSGAMCQDIGAPSIGGWQAFDGTTWTVRGGGSGTSSASDQIHLAAGLLPGDGNVQARFTSETGGPYNAKAGIMLRASTDPGSPYLFAFVSPGGGVAVESRMIQGGGTGQVYASSAPLSTGQAVYLKLSRSGTTFTAYSSTDGSSWTPLGSVQSAALPGTVLAGLAVTSSSDGTSTTATFDNVRIDQCLSGGACTDIGFSTPSGSQSFDGSTWTVSGGGGNGTYGTVDQFYLGADVLPGDGSVQARLTSENGGPYNAKAGVMLRATTDPGSPYLFAFVSPGGGVAVEDRTAQGASAGGIYYSSNPLSAGQTVYLKVARSGSTFTAYSSGDGGTWTPLGSVDIPSLQHGALLAGLAVTSSSNSALTTATFDNMSIDQCFSGGACKDIGFSTPSGSQSFDGSTWTVSGGGGNGTTGTVDQFHLAAGLLSGDGSVQARLTSENGGPYNAKAGVMLRASTDPSAPYFFAFVSPGGGLAVESRHTVGGGTGQDYASSNPLGTTPNVYLKVMRTGDTFTAYTSSDDSGWTQVASVAIPTFGATILGGLAATSSSNSTLTTATFDHLVLG